MKAIPETVPEWRELVAAVVLRAIRDMGLESEEAAGAEGWLRSEDGAVMMEALGLEQAVVLGRLRIGGQAGGGQPRGEKRATTGGCPYGGWERAAG